MLSANRQRPQRGLNSPPDRVASPDPMNTQDAFDPLEDFRSRPIPHAKGKQVTVRVVSQFGEESTKVLTLE